MSIAVAVQKKNQIVLATDSQSSFGSCRVLSDNLKSMKIKKVGSSFIAAAGWGLYDDILEDFFNRKKRYSLRNRNQIFKVFMQFWKELHDKYPLVNEQCGDKDSPFGDLDASFLIVNSAGIFHVASDMSTSHFEKFFAIGSGADYALGVLYALYDDKIDAATMARRAVDAAIFFNVYCGGAIKVQTIRTRR